MKEEGGRTTFQLEEAEHQIAPKPFMGLVKMGPVVEPGYVIRDNSISYTSQSVGYLRNYISKCGVPFQ